MAATQHPLPSCCLIALLTYAFYGAQLTTQQCRPLNLVEIYYRHILIATLPLV